MTPRVWKFWTESVIPDEFRPEYVGECNVLSSYGLSKSQTCVVISHSSALHCSAIWSKMRQGPTYHLLGTVAKALHWSQIRAISLDAKWARIVSKSQDWGGSDVIL